MSNYKMDIRTTIPTDQEREFPKKKHPSMKQLVNTALTLQNADSNNSTTEAYFNQSFKLWENAYFYLKQRGFEEASYFGKIKEHAHPQLKEQRLRLFF